MNERMAVNMSIGSRIRSRREELGMTLEEIGMQLGVHRSTVMRYESGDTKRISLETVGRLAEILQTTPAKLMGWEENDETLDPEIRLIARSMQALPREKRDLLARLVRSMSDIADEEMQK